MRETASDVLNHGYVVDVAIRLPDSLALRMMPDGSRRPESLAEVATMIENALKGTIVEVPHGNTDIRKCP